MCSQKNFSEKGRTHHKSNINAKHALDFKSTKGIKVIRWGIFPEMAAIGARFRETALLANAVIAIGITIWRPENIYIQIFGLINFIHVVSYYIIGSFNAEPKIPNSLIPFTVFDDVDNKLSWIYVPAAILLLILYGAYYVTVAQTIWAAIVI